MSDIIFIKGLLIHAHHGLLEHEAHVGQRFVIDLELDVDLGDAAKSDHLSDTVSYAAVAGEAEQALTTQKFKLLEAAAGDVASRILGRFPQVERVKVTLHKPHAPIAAIFEDVGVILVRSRAK